MLKAMDGGVLIGILLLCSEIGNLGLNSAVSRVQDGFDIYVCIG